MVDRPAVNFYEIGGLNIDPTDPDPLNVYNDPSWRPLLELAEFETDLIRMRSAVRAQSHQAWDPSGGSGPPSIRRELMRVETSMQDGCRVTRTVLKIAGRELTAVTRREPDVDTLWTTEHLLKDLDDLHAYLELPDDFFAETIDVSPLIAEDEQLGDRGVVMVDTEDPLCTAATLFDMQQFTVVAFTEPLLFHRLLEKLARPIHARTQQVARDFPGHLWRIYGPEFATPPYLPPRLFHEYVVRYTGPMVRMIQQHGGFARSTATDGSAMSWNIFSPWAPMPSIPSSPRRTAMCNWNGSGGTMAGTSSSSATWRWRRSRPCSPPHLMRGCKRHWRKEWPAQVEGSC